MRSLFIKFFFSFLLIIVLLVTIGIALTHLHNQEFPPLAHQHFARQAIAEYGREAINVYENEGIHGYSTYAEELYDDVGIRILLFDSRGRTLAQQQAPQRMQRMVWRSLQSGEVVFPLKGERNWLASPLNNSTGETFVIVIDLPDKPLPRHLAKGLARGFRGWRLMTLFFVSGVICFFLARSFAAPIARLRQATQQLAAGDLSTRVGERVKGKNEIAGLARDFDNMAGKIEDLVSSQQRLLRDISHELRSPLARLGVALELARQENNPESQQRALERIELEAERMNEMIGQLLSLTRLESDSSELQRKEFDLTELLEELVQDAAFEAKNRGCNVLLEAQQAVSCFGSPELLARALENVIRNAVKYTIDNSCINVSLQAKQDEIHISICDQGPGVPKDALNKLFEPFYRVADARDRQSGGTGIGLAIAERAVKLHGGSIYADNLREGGLEVKIVLPG